MLVTRIKALLEEKKFSAADLSRYVGVKPYEVSRWLGGKVKIRTEYLVLIAKFLDVSLDYLTGLGSDADGWVILPLLGTVPAGNPVEAREYHIGSFSLPSHIARRVDFGLVVKGCSMQSAGILSEDVVFVKYQPTAENKQIVVACVDGEATIKRFFRTDHKIILQPEAVGYEPILIDETTKKDFRIVGIVTGLWRPEVK